MIIVMSEVVGIFLYFVFCICDFRSVGVLASEEEDIPMNLKMGSKMEKEVIYDEGSSYVTVRFDI